MRDPTQNFGPIGSAVLTFIANKRTNKQTNREAKYIYIDTGCHKIVILNL